MILDGLFKAIASLFKKKTTVVATNTVVDTAPGAGTSSAVVTTTAETPAEIADTDLTAAITIVNNVRGALASPIAVLVTDLIPGTVDDTVREELVKDLPILLAALANIKSFVDTADKSAQLNDILAQIRLSPNMDMDAFLHGLAARVLTKISQGKSVTWSIAVMAVEYFFKNIFKSPAAAQVDVPVGAAPALPGPADTNEGAPQTVN